jgi:hypothetical protein
MTYSKIVIEFLTPFDIDYELSIVRLNIGTTTNTFNFVALRLLPFQVTVGATASETATNFKAAFDLDLSSGFVTTLSTSTITIESETLGEDFIGFSAKDDTGALLVLGVDYNITFNNFVASVDTSNIDLALVRSPHYVSTPFSFETSTKVTIDVTIWSGDLTSVPATPTYTLTRIRPTVNFASLETNLAPVIKSNLTPKPNIDTTDPAQLIDSNSEYIKWIEYIAEYTDPVENIADITGLFSALDGYGYYSENANPTKPDNAILTSNIIRRKAASNGICLIPVLNNGTYTSIDVDSALQLDENFVLSTSNLSSEFVKYICLDCSQITDEIVTITFNGDTPVTLDVEIVDECRYNPKTVVFKNKYGAFETIALFKKSVTSLNVSKEEFVNQFVTNGSYDVTEHQYKDINFEATESITLNSGYISELENESYKQMLLSDQVWFYENGALVPVQVDSKTLEFKTRVNDRLVNYQVAFKYAYNTIQDV